MARSANEMSVTLMFNGGQTRTIFLDRGDPLLASLLMSLHNKGTGAKPGIYNLPLEQGRQSLIFSGADVVALVTDPPLRFENSGQPQQPRVAGADQASARHESNYRLTENFLTAEEHASLLRLVSERAANFVGSTVSTQDTEYRHSKVLYMFEPFDALFRRRIAALVPEISPALGIAPFQVGDIECQMTAHNDGDYFKLHNDNGSPDTATRVLTYVYYFFAEPKRFTGGQFRLYHSRIIGGAYHLGEHAADIEPKNNSVLFFPSYCHHEVLPVHCASGQFADGRFTINGWVRRAA